MLVNLYLRSHNWPDVAVLLQSHSVGYRIILNSLFFSKNIKLNKYATSVSLLTLQVNNLAVYIAKVIENLKRFHIINAYKLCKRWLCNKMLLFCL